MDYWSDYTFAWWIVIFEGIIILVVLSFLTIAANYALQERRMHRVVQFILLLTSSILVLISGMTLWISTLSDDMRETLDVPEVNPDDALLSFIIFFITSSVAAALLLYDVRTWLARFFPKRQDPSSVEKHAGVYLPTDPNAPGLRGFDPANTVHMLALVIAVFLLGTQLGNFVLGGGLEGLAETSRITLESLAINFLPQVIVPLLGVGLFLRRSWPEVMTRLGFVAPKSRMGILPPLLESLLAGAGMGVVMFMAAGFIAFIWSLLVSPETFEAQTEATEAIAESINSWGIVFAVAFAAAIGEEIAFRGALQPVFGLWATALLFTAVHIQYTLTPATLIIFVVALALGWLREAFNLWAAISAHFVYNFIQLALALFANG
ncbi:MAG: CPBP family intramembrane metalloprotease [Chloroflexi bacterium]|nr:CPBP family intramembrane metalloprotease [Chloroflexota bacterium]